MRTIAAFFDLNGTLTTAHIWRGLSRYTRLYRVNMGHYRWFLATHLVQWLLSKVGLMGRKGFARHWSGDMAVLLTGYTWEQARELFHWVMEKEVRPGLCQSTLEALRWHQEKGHMVVLVSSAFHDLLKVVGQELGVPHVVGTGLETHNGRYTGRVSGPVCFGSGKAKLLRDFLRWAGKDVDLQASWAYADRVFDVPLLDMVGNPVAAYPEPALRRHARRQGWTILDDLTPQGVRR